MPGAFIGHLGLDYIDGKTWTIQTPLTYDIGYVGSNKFVVVPAHFKTDFNSIPCGLWNIFPPTRYGKASIIHDYLCEGGFITEILDEFPATTGHRYERHIDPGYAELDGIYKEALEVEGCPFWKRNAMWMGVRLNHLTKPIQKLWS